MARGQRPPQTSKEAAPCKDCTERFTACHDRCPKDQRGEFGYSAWMADREKVNSARKEFIRQISIRKKWGK